MPRRPSISDRLRTTALALQTLVDRRPPPADDVPRGRQRTPTETRLSHNSVTAAPDTPAHSGIANRTTRAEQRMCQPVSGAGGPTCRKPPMWSDCPPDKNVAVGLPREISAPDESTDAFHDHQTAGHPVTDFPGTVRDPHLRVRHSSFVTRGRCNAGDFPTRHYRATKPAENQYWRDTRTRAIPDSATERRESRQPPELAGKPAFPHHRPPPSPPHVRLGTGPISAKLPPAPAGDIAAGEKFRLFRDRETALLDPLPTLFRTDAPRLVSG
jgi:hypothetical protein